MKAIIPNMLSMLRVALVLPMLWVAWMGYQKIFGFGVIVYGISDLLDGALARKWRVESRLGQEIDTYGDALGGIVWLVGSYLLADGLVSQLGVWLGLIVVIAVVYIVLAWVKLGRIGYHFWSGKLMGVMTIVLVAWIHLLGFNWYVFGLWWVVGIWAFMELILAVLLSDKINDDVRSLITILRARRLGQ